LRTRLVPNSALRASVRIFSALGWDRTPHPFRIIAHLRAFVYFLGGDRSILLSYGTSFSKVLIFQGFRGFGDCSPWCLGVAFANREGRFLISFSNFGGRTFSHLLILTLRIRGVGLIPFPGRFRTLRPFSVSGKAVVGLFLRRRPLYPTELRNHMLESLFQDFRA
jgi:hypothetical protein